MNIIVGGALGTSGSDGYIPGASPANPNVLIGKNANGYKIMLDVVGTTLLQITKPAQNSRISLVVAYTDDLSIQSTRTSDTGNPAKNGIIVVNGQSLANPVPPSDSDIRTAITADGAAGSQAVYAIIARITVASNTTTITNTMIAVDNSTMPASAANIAKCRVSLKNATTNIPANSGAPINLDSIDYQTGTEWSNNRFTAKVAGIYVISGRVLSNNASSYNSLVYKNGTANANIISNGVVSGGSIISDTLKLVAGDWIQLGMWNGSSSQASPYVDGNGSNTYINISQIA